MPIYEYCCTECNKTKELILPFSQFNSTIKCECGRKMSRAIGLPQRPIIRKTANDMALESLNSKSTNYIKPYHKKLSMIGL